MVVDHGPIRYLITKIRYDEQEPPKPNSTYLESYLRQHEENKPRLYLRRIQGLESLHSINDYGLNPIFKDDFKDKDGVYIYDSKEELPHEEEKKDEDDFEIRSFVDSDDLETIRKYRNTSFIINAPQGKPRKFRKEKTSRCQRRNKRLQTEVQDIDVTYATGADIEPESQVVDESVEDIAMRTYEEMEPQIGRKVKVDTWKGKGVKRKFGNKSVKIKLTVNRNTRNAADVKQKKKICLCNLAKRIIKTTAELTTAQNKDALSKTLTGVLDSLGLSEDMVSSQEHNVAVSSTKLVHPIDIEEVENISVRRICVCKKRKKNVSLRIIRKTCESTAMVDAQTEIRDSTEGAQTKVNEDGNKIGEEEKLNDDENQNVGSYGDATNKNERLTDEEQDQVKMESNNEVPNNFEDGIQSSVDGSQELRIGENEAEGAKQDKVNRKRSLKKRKRICLCKKKIKNVTVKITKTMASGWSIETEDKPGLTGGQKAEETEHERAAKEIKSKDYSENTKSMRKKRICLCEKQLNDLTIKIIRTSDLSAKKHIRVFKRKRKSSLRKLEHRKKFGQYKLDGEADLEISKMKWRKIKKKLCFCDFHLESIDEEMHTKEELSGSIEKMKSIEEQSEKSNLGYTTSEMHIKGELPGPMAKTGSIEDELEESNLESEASENSLREIFNPGERPDRIEDQSQPNLLCSEFTQTSLHKILVPPKRYIVETEEQPESNILFVKANQNSKIEQQSQKDELASEVNENQDNVKAPKQWDTVQANIPTTFPTVNQHSLQNIQFSSNKIKGNNKKETTGSKIDKTGPAKDKESCLSKAQKPKKILINSNKLGKIEIDKIPMQLGSDAGVDTRKLKHKRKVCFCEDLLKKEVSEDARDLSVLSSELYKKEDGIVIRKTYGAEFSYEMYQETQGLVDEILDGACNRFKKLHELKETGEMSDKLKKLPNIKCSKEQFKGVVMENRSTGSEIPDTTEPNKDDVIGTKVTQKEKTCGCDCNCPENAFCNKPSLIGLGSNNRLSACIKQGYETPDARRCNESVYKVLYASDLKAIIEESNENESKSRNKNQKSTGNIIEMNEGKEECTSISNVYKNTICNRLSPIILFDLNKLSPQSTTFAAVRSSPDKLSVEMALDHNTQTKPRNFTKSHFVRSTSNDKTFDSSLVRLLDFDEDVSLSTNFASEVSNAKLKAIVDELDEDHMETKESKKSSKCKQADCFNEKQGDDIMNGLFQKEPSSLVLPKSSDNNLETGKEKLKKIPDGSGIGSQTQDITFTTERLSKGVSSHKESNQRKEICLTSSNFGKDEVFSKPSLSTFPDSCDDSKPRTDAVKSSNVTKLKSGVVQSDKDNFDNEVSKNQSGGVSRICSYTEDTISKIASPIKTVDPGKHLTSSMKQMDKTSEHRETKSATNECRSWYNRKSVHNAQAKRMKFMERQASTEATNGQMLDNQQYCNSCKAEGGKASNISPLIASENTVTDSTDNADKSIESTVTNIAKANLTKRLTHQGTQTKKTKEPAIILTNSEISYQKEKVRMNNWSFENRSIYNHSLLLVSNDSSGTLTLIHEPVTMTSTSTQHSSDIDHLMLSERPSNGTKRSRNCVTGNTHQSQNLNKNSCSLVKDSGFGSTTVETLFDPFKPFESRSKQIRNFSRTEEAEVISEGYKILGGRASEQQSQMTNRKTANQKGTQTPTARSSDQQSKVGAGEKGHVYNKSSLIISLYPKKYSVHGSKEVSEVSDITVTKSITKDTERGSSDQATQSDEPISVASDNIFSQLEVHRNNCSYKQSHRLSANVPGENVMLKCEAVSRISSTNQPICRIEYPGGDILEERETSGIKKEIQTSSLAKETNISVLPDKNNLRNFVVPAAAVLNILSAKKSRS
nr:unnamed protein product [Callosobruchus analis]